MTQKNKIFSIILSLLVLSSVACRKSGGGNGGGVVTEPGTFSITEASGNVKALVVKPDTTVSDIKIAFFYRLPIILPTSQSKIAKR